MIHIYTGIDCWAVGEGQLSLSASDGLVVPEDELFAPVVIADWVGHDGVVDIGDSYFLTSS